METVFGLAIGAVVVIIICIVIFKLFEGLSQIMQIANIVILIGIILIGAFLFIDFKIFSDSYPQKEKILLIEEDGLIKAALSIKNSSTEILNTATYNQAYLDGNFKKVQKKDQIIIVTNSKLLEAYKGNYTKLPEIFSNAKMFLREYKHGSISANPHPVSFAVIKIIPDVLLKEDQ